MYKNYIEHEKFGRLWYTIDLRNWDVMTFTAEENRKAGPCCAITLEDYYLAAHGPSPQEALKRLEQQLQFSLDTNPNYQLSSKK